MHYLFAFFFYFLVSLSCGPKVKMSLRFYYDLMSQPSRALYIIFKISNVQYVDCPIALRKGKWTADPPHS